MVSRGVGEPNLRQALAGGDSLGAIVGIETRGRYRLPILWLCRLIALMLFCLGVQSWVRLVGLYPGALWRFDLMPMWWKVVAPTLAVLYPVAGVGLWTMVSWGAVVWSLVVAVEAVMHLMFADLFGEPDLVFVVNGIGLATFLLLKLLALFQDRRRLARN